MALMHRQSLVKFDAPLCETIVDVPAPKGGEVLVRVERCGLCHSDLHIQDGYADLGDGKRLDTTRGVTLPFTLGHEIAGIVDAAGPDAPQGIVGRKVAVFPWIGCGVCPACLAGDDLHFGILPGKAEGDRDEPLPGRLLQALQDALVAGVVGDHELKARRRSKSRAQSVHRQLAAVVGERMDDDRGVLTGLHDLVEIADRPVPHRPSQRAVDPDGLATPEEEAADQVRRGYVLVARHGDQIASEPVGHRLHEAGLPAARRTLQQHRQTPARRRPEHVRDHAAGLHGIEGLADHRVEEQHDQADAHAVGDRRGQAQHQQRGGRPPVGRGHSRQQPHLAPGREVGVPAATRLGEDGGLVDGNSAAVFRPGGRWGREDGAVPARRAPRAELAPRTSAARSA